MRKALVAVLTAALVGVPAVAYATVDHCPAGVAEVSGRSNPTLAQVSSWLAASAAAHSVPVSVLKVIAYKESTWRQYTADGHALVSSDATCGLGIMQVTADDRADAVQLATDPAYNIDEGAKILAAKYAGAQGTPPADTGQGDDPDVIENWYYALCLYNGCTNDPTYADAAAGILSDPFRRLPLSFREFMPPAGFSRPQDADPTYTLPSAFQARHNPDVFVFYDATTGAVTKTVPYRTHLVSAPPVVSYPPFSTGPDAPAVACSQCGGWRLAEGVGISGRAHWTTSIAEGGEPQSVVTWQLATTPYGRYRVEVYVPDYPEALAPAHYTMFDSKYASEATVDQEAKKGTWVSLGTRVFTDGVQVAVFDTSTVVGAKILADAVRVVGVPSLSLAVSGPTTLTYGTRIGLRGRLLQGSPLAGRPIAILRRLRGATAWQGLGYWTTDANGYYEANAAPDRNYEYQARFSPPASSGMTTVTSGVVRVDVRTRVAASLSTTANFGEPVTLRASVAPGHPGQSVLVQRWYSNAWHTVSSLRLDSYSRAGWTFRITNTTSPCGSARREYLRVVKPADYDHVAGISPTLTLDVYRC